MWSRLKETDKILLEEVLLLTTPISKYGSIDAWYKDFKAKMRKKMKENNNHVKKRKRDNSKSPKNVSKLRKV